MSRHFNNIMELYIIEKYKELYPELSGRSLTDALIKDCLEAYGVQEPQVLRTPKGKPYIDFCKTQDAEESNGQDVHFSVSHSGDHFAFIAADCPVGIDIQQRKGSNANKIAERYFSDREKEYVKENGEAGFFTVWTRKEAYSKLTGEGIAEIIRGTDVLDRNDVKFTDIQLEDGIWCSYCISI